MSDELKNDILADLATVQRLYDEAFEPMAAHTERVSDLERWRRNVHGAVERTRQAVEAVTVLDNREARSHAALDAAMSVAVLDAQFTSITAQVNINHAAGPVASALSGLINNIKAVVQGLSAQILQLISNLITPAGWAVAGGLGANLFGLQGNVQIEIQFN